MHKVTTTGTSVPTFPTTAKMSSLEISELTGKPIPENVLPESALMLAPITYLSYQTPGTAEFAEAFSAGLKKGSRVFVLQNHGVTVAAETVERAFAGLETLEFVARISHLTGAAPGNLEIDPQLIQELLDRVKGKT